MSRLLSVCVVGFATMSFACGKAADVDPAARATSEYTVPGGTLLNVRLETTVASNTNSEGDPVEAVLTEPVVIDDRDVVPAGATLKGVVADATPSGKVKGRAHLALRFTRLVTHNRDDQSEYLIAAYVARTAPATKSEDAKKIGVGTGAGAIIGGIIGGGKGAAAGAAIGAGGGTAVVLSTAGQNVKFQRGTTWSLPLERPVVVKVPITR
jgi:hypothetical protein